MGERFSKESVVHPGLDITRASRTSQRGVSEPMKPLDTGQSYSMSLEIADTEKQHVDNTLASK
jgi:hypothetical protein